MANYKSKEIQVQKPAQSLQAFQQKLAAGEEEKSGLVKIVFISACALVLLMVGIFAFRAIRANAVEKHEVAVAELSQAVFGDGTAPVAPEEVEKRMRAKLPELEALAKKAPSASEAATLGMVASWKLMLDGKGVAVPAADKDPNTRLSFAQRAISLGKVDEAAALLKPLHSSAKPAETWASLYWTTLMDLHRLKGDREQALKDYADYKDRYKDKADAAIERALSSI